jgi:hypothetical protein
MFHNICRLNFLREMDSQQKDAIFAQCGTCSRTLLRTNIEEEVVTPQPKSICNGSMIIFAGPPALNTLSTDCSVTAAIRNSNCIDEISHNNY